MVPLIQLLHLPEAELQYLQKFFMTLDKFCSDLAPKSTDICVSRSVGLTVKGETLMILVALLERVQKCGQSESRNMQIEAA